MQRTLLIVVGLLGLVLVAGSATRGSPGLTKPGTIRITTLAVDQNVVDRGAPGRDAGDLVVTRQRLYNKGIRARAIGHSELMCTYTAHSSRLCSGTYSLPKGSIVVAGARTYRQFYELAVIGGTGLYDNVRGSLTVTLLTRKPRREILLFRLVV